MLPLWRPDIQKHRCQLSFEILSECMFAFFAGTHSTLQKRLLSICSQNSYNCYSGWLRKIIRYQSSFLQAKYRYRTDNELLISRVSILENPSNF